MLNLNEVTHVVTERGIFVKIAFWLIAQKLARTIPHPEWKPESGFEYMHPPLVHHGSEQSNQEITWTVNSIDDEWQTRRNKRLAQMAKYQMEWPFAFALALCLQTHGEWIELNRKAIKKVHNNGRMLLWPNPENRNVSKRMWNDQNIAAKHCLNSSAKLYFDFWAFCVQRESYIMG